MMIPTNHLTTHYSKYIPMLDTFVLGPTGPAQSLHPLAVFYTEIAKEGKKCVVFETLSRVFSRSVLHITVIFILFFNYFETGGRQKSHTAALSCQPLSHFPSLSAHLLWRILCKLNTKTFISFFQNQHFAVVFYVVIEHDHKVGREL